MIEVLLAVWIVGIGAVAMLPVAGSGRGRGYWALLLPAGYAISVIAALVLTTIGRYSPVGALVLASAASVVGAGAWLARTAHHRAVRWRRLAVEVVAVAGVATIIAAVTQVVHLTRMTPDSMNYLISAGGLARTGGLDGITASAVLKRLLVVPALEAPGRVTGRGYVASVMPLVSIGGFGLTAWLASEALRIIGPPQRWTRWILASAGLFLLTTNRVLFNIGYIHTHMVFATFLLLGAGTAWLALHDRRWQLLIPAALGFAALPMLRAEAVIVCIIFLVPIVTELRIPAAWRWVVAGGFMATTIVWFGIAVPPFMDSSDLDLTGPVLANIVGVVALAALLGATHVPQLRRLAGFAPAATLAAVVAFVVSRAAGSSEVFEESVAAMAANLTVVGRWGTFWLVGGVLVIVAMLVLVVPFQRHFTYPIVTYWVAILAFVYLREGGYRAAPGDSGNRMMMHVVFVTMVYLVAAAAVAAKDGTDPATRDVATPASAPETARLP